MALLTLQNNVTILVLRNVAERIVPSSLLEDDVGLLLPNNASSREDVMGREHASHRSQRFKGASAKSMEQGATATQL